VRWVQEALGRQRDPACLSLGEGTHALNLTAPADRKAA
jgi:hypothetical protein